MLRSFLMTLSLPLLIASDRKIDPVLQSDTPTERLDFRLSDEDGAAAMGLECRSATEDLKIYDCEFHRIQIMNRSAEGVCTVPSHDR